MKKVFHPIICCTLSADLAAYAFGYLSQSGLDPVLGKLNLHLAELVFQTAITTEANLL